ncbi:MAG TPA: hypothetical protein VEO95_07765, partial [Chthoniobacteraceae bacterium]|nr:hypothetical protein [Chthoniobacteraceae bacterium]
ICAMVQGGHHGGSVAAPVAAHILEQVLAMEQGTYKVELASLAPARNPHPFVGIEQLPEYPGAGKFAIGAEAAPEESADAREPSDAKVDMRAGGAAPDIRVAADARGKVGKGRQVFAAPPEQPRNFFQRLFGAKPAPAPPRAIPVAPPRGH